MRTKHPQQRSSLTAWLKTLLLCAACLTSTTAIAYPHQLDVYLGAESQPSLDAFPVKHIIAQRIEGGSHNKKGPGFKHPAKRPPKHKHDKSRAENKRHAADIARQQFGGKVLKVERNVDSYRVKMLRDGRVSYVQVPAY